MPRGRKDCAFCARKLSQRYPKVLLRQTIRFQKTDKHFLFRFADRSAFGHLNGAMALLIKIADYGLPGTLLTHSGSRNQNLQAFATLPIPVRRSLLK